MGNSRSCWWVLSLFVALSAGLPARAAASEVSTLDPPETWIVVAEQAIVMAGNDRVGVSPRGTMLRATRARGPWRFDPDIKGWVHSRDIMPVAEALKHFTAEIKERPTAMAYHLRGIARMNIGEWGMAMNDLQRAYELGENAVTLHFNRGVCLEHLGRPDDALSEYSVILETYPDEFPANMARGHLLLADGKVESALEDFQQACKLQPDSADAHDQRGVALRMLGRYEEALAAYNKALAANPKHASALANRAYTNKSLGEYAVALEDYESAAKLDETSLTIKNDLAWMLATCPDKTIRDSERAVSLSEEICRETEFENGEYLDTLAAAYASAERYEAAVQAAELALTKLADGPTKTEVRKRRELYKEKQAYREEFSPSKRK